MLSNQLTITRKLIFLYQLHQVEHKIIDISLYKLCCSRCYFWPENLMFSKSKKNLVDLQIQTFKHLSYQPVIIIRSQRKRQMNFLFTLFIELSISNKWNENKGIISNANFLRQILIFYGFGESFITTVWPKKCSLSIKSLSNIAYCF